MALFHVCSQLILFLFLSSYASCQGSCPGGLQPICPASTTILCSDGSQPQCAIPAKNQQACPKACNPHLNTCDPTTAPTCIFPDPGVSSPRAACACRPGYKATGYTDNDITKHWRLPVRGQDYRVWVAEGVKCDTLCTISSGVGSCREVTLISDKCIGSATSVNVVDTEGDPISISVVELKVSDTLTIYQVKDTTIFGSLTLNIPILLPTDETLKAHFATEEYIDDVADSIAYAYPIVLEQFGVPAANSEQDLDNAVPDLTSVALAMFSPPNETASSSTPRLVRRKKWKLSVKKIMNGISHVAKEATRLVQAAGKNIIHVITKLVPGDAPCAYFAAVSVQGYMAEAALVYIRSPGPGVPISKDQMFFLYPVYGNYPATESFRAHYDFGKERIEMFRAITFNRDMFILAKTAIYGPSWDLNDGFIDVTRTLIHELQHTKQYRSHGWSKFSFGLTYLHQYCKAGYQYSKIEYEKQAAAKEPLMDALLYDKFGYAFFEYWKIKTLDNILGYPLDRNITRSPQPTAEVPFYELRFQHGVLQGTKAWANSTCQFCFRVLNETALAYRQVSNMCISTRSTWPYCDKYIREWAQYQLNPTCLPEFNRC